MAYDQYLNNLKSALNSSEQEFQQAIQPLFQVLPYEVKICANRDQIMNFIGLNSMTSLTHSELTRVLDSLVCCSISLILKENSEMKLRERMTQQELQVTQQELQMLKHKTALIEQELVNTREDLATLDAQALEFEKSLNFLDVSNLLDFYAERDDDNLIDPEVWDSLPHSTKVRFGKLMQNKFKNLCVPIRQQWNTKRNHRYCAESPKVKAYIYNMFAGREADSQKTLNSLIELIDEQVEKKLAS